MSALPLGLGGGPLGDDAVSDEEATRLVHAALELGIRVLDTAPSYGRSEARIGRALAGRRASATVVTKGGYGVPGTPDWTPECIARGVDRALRALSTDYLDGFVLHSCALGVLESGALLEPLVRAREAGKVRAIGYSGEGEALAWAAGCGALDLVECSVNLFDQRALRDVIPHVAARGVSVLAKRALGNVPWAAHARPGRADAAVYWDRMRAMFPPGTEAPTTELAIRFAAHAPGVSAALVGTRSIAHLTEVALAAARGPLPADVTRELHARFERHGGDFAGVV